VKEAIKRYGPVIDLRETPYVLIEIVRNFGSLLVPDDGGLPPGGVGPVGPASPRVDNALLLREILKIGREVTAIKRKLGVK
jgi:hypothetical protein